MLELGRLFHAAADFGAGKIFGWRSRRQNHAAEQGEPNFDDTPAGQDTVVEIVDRAAKSVVAFAHEDARKFAGAADVLHGA